MKRVRPPIPWNVQWIAAQRQAFRAGIPTAFPVANKRGTVSQKAIRDATRVMLAALFPGEKTHCDHNPPLRTRGYNPRRKDVAARYTPHANDPDHLIHRTVHAHKIKTNIRGDGAQFPDRVLIKRERKRERKKMREKSRKIPVAARRNPWPKGRKIRGRPFGLSQQTTQEG